MTPEDRVELRDSTRPRIEVIPGNAVDQKRPQGSGSGPGQAAVHLVIRVSNCREIVRTQPRGANGSPHSTAAWRVLDGQRRPRSGRPGDAATLRAPSTRTRRRCLTPEVAARPARRTPTGP